MTFADLVSGTTASHIHAPTPLPGTGTAGVATTTPTFTDFPLGVTSGNYDHTLDTLSGSTYNPAFITANGGTPASAEAVLAAALAAGEAYLNIHTSTFPGRRDPRVPHLGARAPEPGPAGHRGSRRPRLASSRSRGPRLIPPEGGKSKRAIVPDPCSPRPSSMRRAVSPMCECLRR